MNMKKSRSRRKTIILGLVIGLLVVVVALIALSFYGKTMMKKIPALSFAEALDYTLKDNPEAIITVGFVKDGQASYTVYGNNSALLAPVPHTYEIGSLTKTITSAMVAKAVQEGNVRLDDTIDAYIALPSGNTYPTIGELVTHTSSYKPHYFEWPMVGNFFSRDNDFYGITTAMLARRLSSLSVSSKRGTYEYSNFGYAVLGLVLQEIYDTEYATLVDAFVRDDFSLRHTYISTMHGDLDNSWEWKRGDAYLSAGGLVSNIEDMLAYAQLQLAGQGFIGASQESLKQIDAATQQFELLDIHPDAIAMAWMWDEQNGMFWHNGATSHYNSYLAFDPVRQMAVVILSNLSPNSRIPATVLGIKLMKELQLF